MFKGIDLSKKVAKGEFGKVLPELKLKLGELQRKVHQAGIPVIVVFEGWEAVGMASILNQFLLPLDPRGFTYNNIGEPDRVEVQMPFMWRFWMRAPWKGRLAIFDRSWYTRAVAECLSDGKCKRLPKDVVTEINQFEKVLADDGTLIIKLFLHTSIEKDEITDKRVVGLEACGLMEEDLDLHKHYRKYLPLLEEILGQTDLPYAPWVIVEADDFEYAVVKVMRTVIERMTKALSAPLRTEVITPPPAPGRSDRADLDLSVKVTDQEYKDQLSRHQGMMRGVQCELFKKKKRLIVVFEGRDASGKGGDINRLTQTLNPRTYEVVGTSAPTDMELSHHFLWRFQRRLPLPGHLCIFDRSWYGRVLVERVDGLSPEPDWRRAYGEINDFEAMLVDNGSILVKLWLEIDKKTQLERFIERVDDPRKTWKITQDDWDARERWDLYTQAIDEMLLRTSTKRAPWTIVESNDKNHSRLKTLRTIVDAAEKGLE